MGLETWDPGTVFDSARAETLAAAQDAFIVIKFLNLSYPEFQEFPLFGFPALPVFIPCLLILLILFL